MKNVTSEMVDKEENATETIINVPDNWNTIQENTQETAGSTQEMLGKSMEDIIRILQSVLWRWLNI